MDYIIFSLDEDIPTDLFVRDHPYTCLFPSLMYFTSKFSC